MLMSNARVLLSLDPYHQKVSGTEIFQQITEKTQNELLESEQAVDTVGPHTGVRTFEVRIVIALSAEGFSTFTLDGKMESFGSHSQTGRRSHLRPMTARFHVSKSKDINGYVNDDVILKKAVSVRSLLPSKEYPNLSSASTAMDNERKNTMSHSIEHPFCGFLQYDIPSMFHQLWMLFVKLGESKAVLELVLKKLSQTLEDARTFIEGFRMLVFRRLESLSCRKKNLSTTKYQGSELQILKQCRGATEATMNYIFFVAKLEVLAEKRGSDQGFQRGVVLYNWAILRPVRYGSRTQYVRTEHVTVTVHFVRTVVRPVGSPGSDILVDAVVEKKGMRVEDNMVAMSVVGWFSYQARGNSRLIYSSLGRHVFNSLRCPIDRQAKPVGFHRMYRCVAAAACKMQIYSTVKATDTLSQLGVCMPPKWDR
ncbi:uncharacterized protein BDR25DRAFT_350161 [Lindgomyces ingoldianus]|uniref:Uncharacterized protein n=1 Tax=Lindgomyces ingoldianus TaxID=673940 RepID=A0ACB6R989_9PLEO|nr:uncharacterized protein BDR25DRAFT_350161 [Lindgomyces ingoldianus]KAF2475894.1 hypothetical protein BDR25DRAFT_350161 [Lindgomyces ingoldianus]